MTGQRVQKNYLIFLLLFSPYELSFGFSFGQLLGTFLPFLLFFLICLHPFPYAPEENSQRQEIHCFWMMKIGNCTLLYTGRFIFLEAFSPPPFSLSPFPPSPLSLIFFSPTFSARLRIRLIARSF